MKRVVLLNIVLLISVFFFSCNDELQVGDECRKERAHKCVNGIFGYCGEDSQITYTLSCDSICYKYGYPNGVWFFEGHCSIEDHGYPTYTQYGCCICVHEETSAMQCIAASSGGIPY